MLAERVTILFGVPVDRDAFHARVEQSDWLHKYVPSGSADKPPGSEPRKRHYDECWHKDYQPSVAASLQDLIKQAEKLGAVVRRQATLADLSQATAEADIVVLMSHWKGPELSNDDFVKPVREADFVERAGRDISPVGRWIDQQFTSNGISGASPPRQRLLARLRALLTGAPKRRTLREILRQSLDADISDMPAAAAHADSFCEAHITRATRRRAHLDSLFAGMIACGNRLELFDGLHAMETIEPAISPDFAGVLDLTTCTSTVLADHISKMRKYQHRTVQFEETQQLNWGADCIGLALGFVAEGQPYLQARLKAGEIVKGLVHEEALARKYKKDCRAR